ncbi:hypothetical protein EDD85DRAFT_859731 [Armillaria nabsnona]|nr:hypothetical protein EDD85DRAFT_859731 [Armillaria nabsnona]
MWMGCSLLGCVMMFRSKAHLVQNVRPTARWAVICTDKLPDTDTGANALEAPVAWPLGWIRKRGGDQSSSVLWEVLDAIVDGPLGGYYYNIGKTAEKEAAAAGPSHLCRLGAVYHASSRCSKARCSTSPIRSSITH